MMEHGCFVFRVLNQILGCRLLVRPHALANRNITSSGRSLGGVLLRHAAQSACSYIACLLTSRRALRARCFNLCAHAAMVQCDVQRRWHRGLRKTLAVGPQISKRDISVVQCRHAGVYTKAHSVVA